MRDEPARGSRKKNRRRKGASHLPLRDLKRMIPDEHGYEVIFKGTPVLEFDGADATIFFDDQPGVEEGWVGRFPDGDDMMIDAKGDVITFVEMLEDRWGLRKGRTANARKEAEIAAAVNELSSAFFEADRAVDNGLYKDVSDEFSDAFVDAYPFEWDFTEMAHEVAAWKEALDEAKEKASLGHFARCGGCGGEMETEDAGTVVKEARGRVEAGGGKRDLARRIVDAIDRYDRDATGVGIGDYGTPESVSVRHNPGRIDYFEGSPNPIYMYHVREGRSGNLIVRIQLRDDGSVVDQQTAEVPEDWRDLSDHDIYQLVSNETGIMVSDRYTPKERR